MGMRLVDELVEHAPPDLGTSQRLLAMVIAHDANDQTREGFPGMAKLTRRTGLAANSVRRVLGDLERAKVIERVPAGIDRAGGVVYAHRGRAMVLRVRRLAPVAGKTPVHEPLPDMPTPVDNRPQGGRKALAGEPQLSTKPPTSERHRRRKGAHPRAERRSSPSERRPLVSTLSSVSSGSRQISAREHDARAAVVDALQSRTGRTIDSEHAGAVARQLLDGRPDIRDPAAYLRAAITRDPDPARFLPTPTPPRFRAVPNGERPA